MQWISKLLKSSSPISQQAHEVFGMPFEELFALQFFGKELMFWLNTKDVARLRQCSKALNQSIKMENVFMENEPLMFRKLVFQKKFDLLEKCIPFRINKDQKYPATIDRELYKGIAQSGNLKAMQNLFLQTTISPQIESAFFAAINSNQIDIVRVLMKFWVSLHSKVGVDYFIPFFQRAYQLNRREILIVFFEALSISNQDTNPKWKSLFDFILKHQQQQQSENVNEHFIDHLFSLSSSEYLYYNNIQSYFQFIQNPNLMATDLFTNSLSFVLKSFPIVVPPRVMNEMEILLNTFEFKFENEKPILQNYLMHSKARWSVFVDDFETFKSLTTSFEFLWERSTHSYTLNTLFDFVIARTTERQLRLDFFNHCLSILRDKAKIGSNPIVQVENSFNSALQRAVKAKRNDLFHELINLPFYEKYDELWPLDQDFPITVSKFGNVEMLKELIEHKKRNFKFEVTIPSITDALLVALNHQNYEIVEYLLILPKSKLGGGAFNLNWIGETILSSSDVELLKRISKQLNFENAWMAMLSKAVSIQDEIAVEYVLTNLMKNKKEKEDYVEFLNEMLKKKNNLKTISLLNDSIRKWSK